MMNTSQRGSDWRRKSVQWITMSGNASNVSPSKCGSTSIVILNTILAQSVKPLPSRPLASVHWSAPRIPPVARAKKLPDVPSVTTKKNQLIPLPCWWPVHPVVHQEVAHHPVEVGVAAVPVVVVRAAAGEKLTSSENFFNAFLLKRINPIFQQF